MKPTIGAGAKVVWTFSGRRYLARVIFQDQANPSFYVVERKNHHSSLLHVHGSNLLLLKPKP